MPIRFDRYQVPGAPASPLRVPVLGPDYGPAQALESLSRASGALGAAAHKRQQLKDQTTLAERYMQAAQDMEDSFTQLQASTDQHEKASETWRNTIERGSANWYKDLRPEVATQLKRSLLDRQMTYARGASKLQTGFLISKAQATVVASTELLEQQASRLDVNDTDALKDVVGRLNGDGTSTPGVFEQMLDGYVGLGLITEDQKVTLLLKARGQAAYARALRIANDQPTRYQELMAAEDGQQGSTFLTHLDPSQRSSLSAHADGRVRTLEAQGVARQDRARSELARMHTEAAQQFETRTAKMLDEGQLSKAWLDDGIELRLIDEPTLRYYLAQLEQREVSGGLGDPATLRRFSVEVYDTANPAKTRNELRAAIARREVPAGPGSIASQWLSHLEEKVKVASQTPPVVKERHGQAVALTKELLRVSGPLATIEKMDQAAQHALVSALEDLDRNASSGYPEDPMALYFRKKNVWLSQLGASAETRLLALTSSLVREGLPAGDPVAMLTQLEARRATMKPLDYYATLQRIKDYIELSGFVTRTNEAARLAPQSQSQTPRTGPLQAPGSGRGR